MPDMYRMRDVVREKYDEELDTAMPRLIAEYKTPFLIANHLGVYPNAVRFWLRRNRYHYNGKEWVKESERELNHA